MALHTMEFLLRALCGAVCNGQEGKSQRHSTHSAKLVWGPQTMLDTEDPWYPGLYFQLAGSAASNYKYP